MQIYGNKKNVLLEDAFRIESPTEDLKALYVQISKSNLNTLECANIADYLFKNIYSKLDSLNNKRKSLQDPDVYIIVVDFGNVDQVGSAFLDKYLKYCLTSKYKVYNVNLSISCQRAFSTGILNSFSLVHDDN